MNKGEIDEQKLYVKLDVKLDVKLIIDISINIYSDIYVKGYIQCIQVWQLHMKSRYLLPATQALGFLFQLVP